ncbi:MAG: NYN domain-containing protein [Chryseobacterium sp.]|nr:MAG: NYN domain-containing protein [Chryseobacterium sp.]
MEDPHKINVYIDGFNFYYGLKTSHWKKFYWLDIVGFYEFFAKENQIINQVNYFSAKSRNKDQYKRQKCFFDANKDNEKFNLILGKYIEKDLFIKGQRYKTYEEKMTDVNIAIHLLRNIFYKNCDTSIIVTADSDIVPVLKLAKEIDPTHKIICHFPPSRNSNAIKKAADTVIQLDRYEKRFAKCILPSTITLKDSRVIEIPDLWIVK